MKTKNIVLLILLISFWAGSVWYAYHFNDLPRNSEAMKNYKYTMCVLAEAKETHDVFQKKEVQDYCDDISGHLVTHIFSDEY